MRETRATNVGAFVKPNRRIESSNCQGCELPLSVFRICGGRIARRLRQPPGGLDHAISNLLSIRTAAPFDPQIVKWFRTKGRGLVD